MQQSLLIYRLKIKEIIFYYREIGAVSTFSITILIHYKHKFVFQIYKYRYSHTSLSYIQGDSKGCAEIEGAVRGVEIKKIV